MVDHAETVRKTLQTNWNLTGELTKAKIDFTLGKPASRRTYPCIEVLHDPSLVESRVSGLYVNPERLVVDVWLKKPDYSSALSLRDDAVKEVKRIILAKRTSMSDIKFARVTSVMPRDEVDEGIARSQLAIECLYFESA